METLSATRTLIRGSGLGTEVKALVVGGPGNRVTNCQEFYGGKWRLTRSPAAPGALSFLKSCWRGSVNSVESDIRQKADDSSSRLQF